MQYFTVACCWWLCGMCRSCINCWVSILLKNKSNALVKVTMRGVRVTTVGAEKQWNQSDIWLCYFSSTGDIELCNSMDLSGACPTYQTDKQYTVQINSSSEVYSSYIQNHYKIYTRRKAFLTATYNQTIQFILQYFSKLYAMAGLKTCNLPVIQNRIKAQNIFNRF